MVSQWRYALRRHSSSQEGSRFFAEMRRTISSLRPLGIFSSSMAVIKPYGYSCPRFERGSVRRSLVMGSSLLSGGESRTAFPLDGRGLERDRVGHLGQRDAVERLQDHLVDLHPIAFHDA